MKATKKLGHWCVCYVSPKNPSEEKVLQRINSTGVVVSANKYSQIMNFGSYKEAHDTALILMGEKYNYRVRVRKFFLATNDNFYLT
jgi:hypothetical protein